MPVSLVTCPNCNVQLKPKTPVPEGTRLKCPKCATVFAVGGGAPAAPAPPPKPAAPKPAAPKPAAAKPAAPRPRPAPAPEAADDEEVVTAADDDAADVAAADEGAAPARPKKKMPTWAWFAIGGGALLLLCCCGGIPIGYVAVTMLGGAAVNQTNYDKIKMGMSEKDATDKMGVPPTQTQSADDLAKQMGVKMPKEAGNIKALVWKNGDDFITVTIVKDKVVAKAAHIGMTTENEGDPSAAFR